MSPALVSPARGTLLRVGARLLLGAAVAAPLAAQATTERVSVDSLGVQGRFASNCPSISEDGRYVVFVSGAGNLVPNDSGFSDVFLRDRFLGSTERISVSASGAQANGPSYHFGYTAGLSISADGRYVVFESDATNLVAVDANGFRDVFLRDRLNGTTTLVSVDSTGLQANRGSLAPALSADGRFVAFSSDASNLVPADTNGARDVFVHDIQTGVTERVSVDSSGAQANLDSSIPALSADGRFVAFQSQASNLVPGDTNLAFDCFRRDRQSGITERISTGPSGAEGDLASGYPRLSADGRWVAFTSGATNLVAGDTNGTADVFVHDCQAGTTERVNISSSGVETQNITQSAAISADGRWVTFSTAATNLVRNDWNTTNDIFVHDRQSRTTVLASLTAHGGPATSASLWSSISANGRFIAFDSLASNLVAGDTNGVSDVFVRDRGATGTDLCQAGSGGVIACPCSNPPGNGPRGCDNSSATGGAQLASTGSASVSVDSVVFVTNGETPTATSIVLQGDAELPNGVVFGQGVSCVGGGTKRLYVETASGGSITAPAAGEPSISATSAALGDPIGAGTSRWYSVYYRDLLVLGGCPATDTFNTTQTQLLAWGW